MNELDRFVSILSLLKKGGCSGFSSIASKTCKICRQRVIGFRNAVSEFEYSVSGICQTCQDKYIYRKNEAMDR